jgi:hypothetical protein
MSVRKQAAKKAALTRKHRAAGIKAARARKLREAGRKAAVTKRRREAARKAVETRRRNLRTARGIANRESASIRGLTIRQPWAELILRGRKPYELRSWETRYRGPLLIHAGANVERQNALAMGLNPDNLISGAYVGIVWLTEVRPHSRKDARLLKKNRAGFGWFPGNFSWVLRKPRRIPPIKAKGKLGLINVSRAVLRRIGKLPS